MISERGMLSDVIIAISNLRIEFNFNIYGSLVLLAVRNYRKTLAQSPELKKKAKKYSFFGISFLNVGDYSCINMKNGCSLL
jgi:hypothetical protein